jgi:L-ascorbate metabolism protein UlaG (beta-lactamase superfamily)
VATELTWLGHTAFRVGTPGGTRIYVDPLPTEALRELAPADVEILTPEPDETLTF